ncbi:MAG TPA: hypothetical protein VGB00_19285 [Pyrinomonadaceae bacterium]|jgi:hypothetical protein
MIADPAGFIDYENATTGNKKISVVERVILTLKNLKAKNKLRGAGNC